MANPHDDAGPARSSRNIHGVAGIASYFMEDGENGIVAYMSRS